jgi:hypothetical protein
VIRRGNKDWESRLVKLDPIKKIPELMGSPLPTAIKVGRNGPRQMIWRGPDPALPLSSSKQGQLALVLI